MNDTLRRSVRAFSHVNPETVANALGINYEVSAPFGPLWHSRSSSWSE